MARPTRDLIFIVLAVGGVACLLAAVVGVVAIRLADHQADVLAPATALGGLLTGILGAVLGYLLGRGGDSNGRRTSE